MIGTIPLSIIEKKAFKPTRYLIFIILAGLFSSGFIIWHVVKVRVKPLSECKNIVNNMANGDLTGRLHLTSLDEIGSMIFNINKLAQNLETILTDVQTVSQKVASSAFDMSATSETFNVNAMMEAGLAKNITVKVEGILSGMNSPNPAPRDQKNLPATPKMWPRCQIPCSRQSPFSNLPGIVYPTMKKYRNLTFLSSFLVNFFSLTGK